MHDGSGDMDDMHDDNSHSWSHTVELPPCFSREIELNQDNFEEKCRWASDSSDVPMYSENYSTFRNDC